MFLRSFCSNVKMSASVHKHFWNITKMFMKSFGDVSAMSFLVSFKILQKYTKNVYLQVGLGKIYRCTFSSYFLFFRFETSSSFKLCVWYYDLIIYYTNKSIINNIRIKMLRFNNVFIFLLTYLFPCTYGAEQNTSLKYF